MNRSLLTQDGEKIDVANASQGQRRQQRPRRHCLAIDASLSVKVTRRIEKGLDLLDSSGVTHPTSATLKAIAAALDVSWSS